MMDEMTNYPALTVGGETVTVVRKIVEQGDRPAGTTILVDSDGKKYRPSKNGLKLVPLDSEFAVGGDDEATGVTEEEADEALATGDEAEEAAVEEEAS